MSGYNNHHYHHEENDFFPSSVEEAGALLGMAITQLTMSQKKQVLNPPVGMHSSFRVSRPSTALSNVLSRLYQLRALLRSSDDGVPLVSAPSILAVLVKMIGVSTHLAPAYNTHAVSGVGGLGGSSLGGGGSGGEPLSPSAAAARRPVTPPMLSHAIRRVWVDCVALCHVRGAGLTGTARIDTSKFLRNMLALALQNPRAARAAGGVRIAALDVVAALLHSENINQHFTESLSTSSSPTKSSAASNTLVLQTAPWALDILQVCLKALRSAGNGEATYRVSAVQTAIRVAIGSRKAQILRQEQLGEGSASKQMVLPGAMEDKALAEASRLLKQATQDKLPEVRCAAAQFAAYLAPLLYSNKSPAGRNSSSDAALVEDVLTLCWRQLDDEASAYTVHAWAEAVARILAAILCYHVSYKASGGGTGGGATAANKTNVAGGASGAGGAASAGAMRVLARDIDDGIGAGADDEHASSRAGRAASMRVAGGGGKMTLYSQATMSLKRTFHYLVDSFVKAGGEMVAGRLGGAYSTGGRAVRVGISTVIWHLLQLRNVMGPDVTGLLSLSELICLILPMVGGSDMEKQLRPPDVTTLGGAFVGVGRTWSKADAGVARALTCRVLRDGLASISPEPTQLTLLQELVHLMPGNQAATSAPAAPDIMILNAHQMQCVLVELSHLIATLREGMAAKISELVKILKPCLEHEDWGVRHEAAVACQSLSVVSPDTGRDLVEDALSGIQMHHAQLMTLSPAMGSLSSVSTADDQRSSMRMFRRSVKGGSDGEHDPAETLPHQYAIHGLCLVVSMIIRELPYLSRGLPSELARTVASVAEILIASQFNEILIKSSSESAACTCVRGGFLLISSIMATGPEAISQHVPWVFGAWQKATNSAKPGGSKFLAPNHDLVCIDAVLYSVVVFLKYCSELLLAVPQALTQITVLLEDLLPLLMADGRLGDVPLTPHISTRLESARASLLEAFAWLPAGSYPMAADAVFAFAAENIQSAVYSEIACSILPELLSKEDSVLDTCSLARIKREGQSGAALHVEQTVLLLTAEFSHPVEREAVLHLHDRKQIKYLNGLGQKFRRSHILGANCINKTLKAPTPLHDVGMWRRPMDPSSSAKIRLVDAAVQAFAATFGLKSGREQQSAMNMLEALVPQYFAHITRTLNSSLTSEQSKVKDDCAPAVSNITAVLLLCLKSLPLHESTNNVPIGLGPPWMNKAKDILLTVLPSASNAVRRAAAECLALLATLGVTEDAHFLQSTVLHSLDEVRQGNKPDGKPRTIAFEPVSAARAGSLLTLACIQRTANLVAKRQRERARGRAAEGAKGAEPAQGKEPELPLLQMMTRILPSIGDYGFTDFFEVRTFALQSFQILLAYSSRLDKPSLDDVDKQLLRKAVEIVEDNVCCAWIVASNELDKGHESEKMASEPAFLAVVLRLMAFVIPHLKILEPEDDGILSRFSIMARLILERGGEHPSIAFEGTIFYEVMAGQVNLLPPLSKHVATVETPTYSMIPAIFAILAPNRPRQAKKNEVLFSFKSLRSSVYLVIALAQSGLSLIQQGEGKVIGLLAAALEDVAGQTQFLGTGLLRSMVVPRRVEATLTETEEAVGELVKDLPELLLHEPSQPNRNYPLLLRAILFARVILSGVGSVEEEHNGIIYTKAHVIQSALVTAKQDAGDVLKTSSSPRWQTKATAARIASTCLGEILALEHHRSGTPASQSHHFDPVRAAQWCKKQCKDAKDVGDKLPSSLLAFHLQELVASSCMSSVASLDQSELYTVQESSLQFLSNLIQAFSQIPDPEMPGSDLLHQYSQQIFSVVKHSLSSIDEVQTEASFRVFLLGCKTVSVIIKEKMTTEHTVLKRLIRPMIPPDDQLTFGPISMMKPALPFDEAGYSNLVKMTRICFAGDLVFGDRGEGAQEEVSEELIHDRAAFGVESALLALEGARLLLVRNLTLAGRPRQALSRDNDGVSGLRLVEELYKLDKIAVELVISAWATCARAAVRALCTSVEKGAADDSIQEQYSGWLKVLGTLVIQGCEDSANALVEIGQTAGSSFIDKEMVFVECLRGLSLLMKTSEILPSDCLDLDSVGRLAVVLQKKFVEPLMTTKTPLFKKGNAVKQLCLFYRDFALFLSRLVEEEDAEKGDRISLILCPLDVLQQGRLTPVRIPIVADIINASLDGTACFVRHQQIPGILVGSLVDFVACQLLESKDVFAIQLHDSAKSLLLECMSHPFVTEKDKKRVTLQMAQAGQWDAWGSIFKAIGDVVETESLKTLKQVLVNAVESDAHIAALEAVISVVNGADFETVGRIIASVGAEILNLLCYYGTLASTLRTETTKRHKCFANAMKAVLCLYQQVLTLSCLPEFLSTIFETFLAILRFNGLPNAPSPQEKGEAMLGRLVAQAVLHIARTSPESFKACMGGKVNEQDRAVLEFSVRGEMTGYVQANQQAPFKKKLNLKGFKK